MFLNATNWKNYFLANGILTTGEFLIGTSLNLICLTYFLRKRSSAINLLFVFVSATDLSLSSIMVFSAISAFSEGQALMFSNKLFCNIWGLIWHTGCGFSIFLMAVLAITRWLGLAHPLKRVKKRYVAVSILIYLLVQVFKSTMNFWYKGQPYAYHPVFLGCTVSNIDAKDITTLDKLLYLLLYVFEVVLPGIPVTIFSVATFASLLKRGKDLTRDSARSTTTQRTHENEVLEHLSAGWQRKREATITILILLATYLVLNVWFWLLTLGDAFYIFSDKTLNYTVIWNGDRSSYFMTYYAIYIHTVVLNSTANAIIYILRLKGIKSYILYLLKNAKKTDVYTNHAVLIRKRTTEFVMDKFPRIGLSGKPNC